MDFIPAAAALASFVPDGRVEIADTLQLFACAQVAMQMSRKVVRESMHPRTDSVLLVLQTASVLLEE